MNRNSLTIVFLACILIPISDILAQQSRSRRSGVPRPLLYAFPENPSTTPLADVRKEMLEKFVSGDLSVGVNLAISAHVEMCDQCKSAIQEIELRTADQWTNAEFSSPAVYQADTASMIDSIIATPQLKEPIEEESEVGSIHMLDRSVKLPKVLAKAASEGLVWKQLGAGISQADVKIDEEAHCSFLYMKPGSQTPVHKHQGTETTLVLDGSMTDELGEYGK